MTRTPTVLGTTDEVTTCDCCGRADLQKTVALDFGDGEPAFYGRVCAALALQWPVADVAKAARKADAAKHEAARKAQQAAHAAAFARQQVELDRLFPDIAGHGNRLAQVMRLRAMGRNLADLPK